MSNDDEDGTHPRRRVVDLMQRMARATALGSAAFGLAAAESCSPLVCDPLPPPITCANPTRAELQSAMTIGARWDRGDGGVTQVRLQIDNHSRSSVTFSPALALTGASLEGVVVTATSLDAAVVPDAGVATVTATVPFDCYGTADRMTISLDVSGTPTAGATVPATITAP